MTPRGLDVGTVQARLRLMRGLLGDLATVGDVSGERLRQERLLRHAVERILTQLVDLAAGINAHVVAAGTGTAPQNHRESFSAAATAGMIESDLAAALAPAVGLRNLLVHEYAAVDLDLVAAAVPRALDDMGRYVRSVALWITDQHG